MPLLGLVLAYFALDKEAFVRRYLETKPDLLQQATTARSYQRIVSDLANPAQIRLVAAPTSRNLLILAGPGSGKTRTVVHRCAYLLRVERVRPQSVLVCCFNRQAAIELRRRLTDLVGDDARGVLVLTYHGLAMRLLGCSFAGRAEAQGQEFDFDALITRAVQLLRGEQALPGVEPDEVRDRLLAGFQHILVDEYQDIDEPQYEMISAIAGRTLDDPDLKLSILAVGDDDQNIYTFRGANVQFIRRFQRDYEAEVHYLVENYRSTRHIIEAANQLISANTDRMKTDRPVRIDRRREKLPPGGAFGATDDQTGGKVQVLQVPSASSQARAVLAELQRLRQLPGVAWSNIAVLSSTHRELAQVRALAEQASIPFRWFAGRNLLPPLHQVREIRGFLSRLAEERRTLMRASDLCRRATTLLDEDHRQNPWTQFLQRVVEAWRSESNDAELPGQEALEFLYESCAESRRDFSHGQGVALSTVHAAKGTEYDHVLLIGAWPLRPDRAAREETRRTFYVGMTRARQSLTVFDRAEIRPSLPETLAGPAILRAEFDAGPGTDAPILTDYSMLGLEDIYLGYPGQFEERHPVHTALAELRPGHRLEMRLVEPEGIGLFDPRGTCVARLSRKAAASWRDRLGNVREVRVLALVHRSAAQEPDQARRERYRVAEWEVPVAEVVCAAEGGSSLPLPEGSPDGAPP